MHYMLCVLMTGGLVAGCASAPVQSQPATEIAWASELIDAQRVIKKRLLTADPIERTIEGQLQLDPRVESARFAITIPGFGMNGVSDTASFDFVTVVTTRQHMADDEVQRLLQSACQAAGTTATLRHSEIVRDGNTWAVQFGLLKPTTADNPDLSVLRDK